MSGFIALSGSLVHIYWVIFALNLGLIIYLMSLKIVEHREKIKFSSKERLFLVVFVLALIISGIIAIQSGHYAVASDAWYDTYAGKEVSQSNFSYLEYYKYGYTYPYTLAILFLLSQNVTIISYFSLFCFLSSMAFIFLSLYTLTGNKAISYVSLGITLSLYFVLKFTFLYQGKEIFIFLLTAAILFSFSLLYRKYDYRTLLLSVLLILFAANVKYEMVNLVILIPIVLYLSKTKVTGIKKDIVDKKNAILTVLTFMIIAVTAIDFVRYFTGSRNLGAEYQIFILQYGSGLGGYFSYLMENVSIFMGFIASSLLIVLIISLPGIILTFRKYKQQLFILLIFGFVCLISYFIYFPFIIQERFFSSVTVIIIAFASIGIGSVFSVKRRWFRPLLVTLVLSVLIITLYGSVIELGKITRYDSYYHQDVEINRDILDRIPGNQSALIVVPHWNTRFLLKTINNNNNLTILSFDHSDGIVAQNVSEMIYNNVRDVSDNYPFIFEFDRPTYFIYDFYCEHDFYEHFVFLCDAMLNKRYDSEIVHENSVFKLYRVLEK